MTPSRYEIEFTIRKFREELSRYDSVFRDRIIPSFASLEDDTRKVEEDSHESMSSYFNREHDDPGRIAEAAYEASVNYYLETDAIRQGVYNLMVAGLFHLLEQQSQYLVSKNFSDPTNKPNREGGFLELKKALAAKLAINVEGFQCWAQVNELNQVANVVKHADGPAAKKLKLKNPAIFADPYTKQLPVLGMPLRPLVGEGLTLSEAHFGGYKKAIAQFWDELSVSLTPHF